MVQAVTDSAPLRIGVIGVGIMGANHARVLAGLSGVKLAGVADPDAGQREFITRALGCPAVADLDALCKLGVDAVTLAAPTHLHHEIGLPCVRPGVPVMVEKPSASTVEEGRESIAAGG